jgi:hypothetical protein
MSLTDLFVSDSKELRLHSLSFSASTVSQLAARRRGLLTREGKMRRGLEKKERLADLHLAEPLNLLHF